ncbi:hypothetical protein GCM10010472_19050 [Pseudonocardia halophobica]|uniref:Uncharacterized protein n=2 Tax=Pseudonocardia halophobica TaxID=29401 RepID=A0A9W6NUW2_9PSEU|nr:hypothetical protein GCM10017577_10210 [Pseudonocardia halophobica]
MVGAADFRERTQERAAWERSGKGEPERQSYRPQCECSSEKRHDDTMTLCFTTRDLAASPVDQFKEAAIAVDSVLTQPLEAAVDPTPAHSTGPCPGG